MKAEEKLLEHIGKENAFKLPEGYFDHLTEKIMEGLPEKEAVEVHNKPVTLWAKLKPLLYLAAMFVGAALIIRVASWNTGQVAADASLEADTDTLTEQFIDFAVSGSMMDDYSLYVYLTDDLSE